MPDQIGRCWGASLDTYKKGLRRHAKHVAAWTADGHYYGFADAKSPRANRRRAQERLLAAMLKETADAA